MFFMAQTYNVTTEQNIVCRPTVCFYNVYSARNIDVCVVFEALQDAYEASNVVLFVCSGSSGLHHCLVKCESDYGR